jgi:hypothetical protein
MTTARRAPKRFASAPTRCTAPQPVQSTEGTRNQVSMLGDVIVETTSFLLDGG